MNASPNMSTAPNRIGVLCQRGGHRDPYLAALEIVNRTITDSGVTTPPFDPRRYCDLHHVEVRDRWLPNCAARLLPTRAGYIAEIQADDPQSRKNFSICHELAHTFFFSSQTGSSSDEPYARGAAADQEERLCDFIAAELLMPRNHFRAGARTLVPSIESVQRLAGMFAVSLNAAMFRCMKLDTWECYYVDFALSAEDDVSVQSWAFSSSWVKRRRSTISFRALARLALGSNAPRCSGIGLFGGDTMDSYQYRINGRRRLRAFVYRNYPVTHET